MPMNQSERQYIEYRPSIKERVFQLIPSTIEAEKYESFFPDAIKMQIDYPYIDTINKVKDLLQNLNNMINNISKALSNLSIGGNEFLNYQKDLSVKELFDDYHQNNINRNIKGEVYPILLDLKNGVTQVSDFIAKDLFDLEKINLEDDEEVKKIENIESKKIINTANKFIENGLLTDEIYELQNKNKFNMASIKLLNKYEKITDKMSSLLDLKISDYFSSDIDSLITGLSSANEDILSQLNQISEIKFNKLKNELDIIKERINQIASIDREKIYLNEIIKINDLINKNRQVVAWMHRLKTPLYMNGMNDFLEESLDVIEDAFNEYELALVDFYRHIELKEIEYDKYIDKLIQKEKSKQMYQITDDIKNNFNYEENNKAKQVQRFINQYTLKEN